MGHAIWKYRVSDAGVHEANRFPDSDDIPAGWFDSPQAAQDAHRLDAESKLGPMLGRKRSREP